MGQWIFKCMPWYALECVLARVYPMCGGMDCGLLLLEKNKKLSNI